MTSTAVSPTRDEFRIARAVTDGLEPKNWIIAVTVLIGWHSGRFGGIAWGLLGALFSGVIPILFIKFGERRGYWGDRHVRRRQDRLLVIPGIMASVVAGMALMLLFGAPQEMVALVAAMLATLVAILAITTGWKISVHGAVSAGSVIMLTQAYGPWMLLGYVLVALVGWSRIELRDHTRAQVVAGTCLGSLIAASTFALLR
ncbi:hypothetical protein LO771_23235 [Streptacidiphilus sp. ASG 303]|uniref:hypothetical protein n=1 Tax=Streptacidiphilus sp. ASG 303 TaxID=2896847 RepID=UPI001E5ADEBE|nr:hypothetical protein [Streptacidiphilus sp. ASG 303]MCD0485218.1 hypothetical protein [Streptacidiphilus sp. ASG 303]